MKDISIKISQKRGKNVFFYVLQYSSQAMQSIIVADFTISVYGSSCNYHLFSFFLALCFIFLFDGIPKAGWDAKE